MKIRNVLSSMVVALAAASGAHAENVPPVDAAYDYYVREAGVLAVWLDDVEDRMKDPAPINQETAQTLELRVAVIRARHDLALGHVLAEVAKQQQQKP